MYKYYYLETPHGVAIKLSDEQVKRIKTHIMLGKNYSLTIMGIVGKKLHKVSPTRLIKIPGVCITKHRLNTWRIQYVKEKLA